MEAEQKVFEEHIKAYEALLNGDPDAKDPDAIPVVSWDQIIQWTLKRSLLIL